MIKITMENYKKEHRNYKNFETRLQELSQHQHQEPQLLELRTTMTVDRHWHIDFAFDLMN